MQIVISNLTRMAPGFFCFAGIDLETKNNIRPVVPGNRLPTSLLKREPVKYQLRSVIDIGYTKPLELIPESEDNEFSPFNTTFIRELPFRDFWYLLRSCAKFSLFSIFGKELRCRGSKYFIETDTGKVSLGYFLIRTPLILSVVKRLDNSEQVRINGRTKYNPFDLSITDLRLYSEKFIADRDLVVKLNDELTQKMWIVLCVGLTRAFATSSDYRPVHWVQVNNILIPYDPPWFPTRK